MINKAGATTREKLVETAIDLIWQSGYTAVSVDGICKAAGVQKGSFYHFFPSKTDLAVAAIDESFARFRPVIEEVFAESVPPAKRFELLADFGYEHQKEVAEKYGMVCGCPFLTMGAEMAPQNEAIRSKTDEIMTIQRGYFERALKDMIKAGMLPQKTNVKAKAREIHAFIMGQLVMARIQNSLKPIKSDLKPGLISLIGAKEKILEDA